MTLIFEVNNALNYAVMVSFLIMRLAPPLIGCAFNRFGFDMNFVIGNFNTKVYRFASFFLGQHVRLLVDGLLEFL